MNEKPVLYFDQHCTFCRQLALLTERRFAGELRVEGWPRSDSIGFFIDGELYTGDVAWQRLLAREPSLKAFSWLASKLGLERKLARSIRSSAAIFRLFCPSCRKRN